MDAMLSLMFKFLLIAVAAGGVFLGKKYFNAKDDNFVEEIIEDQIERQTGLDIDLTPDSPEKRVPTASSNDKEE